MDSYIVAYDISHPKRLRKVRVHARISGCGANTPFSYAV